MFKFLFSILGLGICLFASNSIIQNVPVEYSQKTYTYENEYVPYQDCYQEKINYSSNNYENTNSIGLDTIIGGIAGVAIGNQIGKGSGRDAAKVIGGITGGLIANNMRKDNSINNRNQRYHTRTERKCRTKYHTINKKVFKGYKNYFYLNGKKEYKFSKYRLNTIPVTIDYSW